MSLIPQSLTADPISLVLFGLLLLMSISSWFIMGQKLLQSRRAQRANGQFLARFTPNTTAAQLQGLAAQSPGAPFAGITQRALDAQQSRQGQPTTPEHTEAFLTRVIRQSLDQWSLRNENGMTWLATVSSSAPFVGLFGTVWGVYHALTDIGRSGSASLSTVAGPVGEALIMTGLGLAVALPALMGYNTLSRYYHTQQTRADGFAFELLSLLTLGQPPLSPQGAEPLKVAPSRVQV